MLVRERFRLAAPAVRRRHPVRKLQSDVVGRHEKRRGEAVCLSLEERIASFGLRMHHKMTELVGGVKARAASVVSVRSERNERSPVEPLRKRADALIVDAQAHHERTMRL